MPTPLNQKSTTSEIRERFDQDVERFAQLETGQAATIDAPLVMELITSAAVAATSPISRVLDLGCGAGNNTLKLRQVLNSDFDVDLVDLSRPMLQRAAQRLQQAGCSSVVTHQEDLRTVDLPDESFDIILAAAVLHHLREDADWQTTFEKLHRLLRPGGSLWITDMVAHENTAVHELMWDRYGRYLVGVGGEDYRDAVFAYIDQEDSPRPVTWQLDLLRRVGFQQVELLHKNSCFAAFGAIRAL